MAYVREVRLAVPAALGVLAVVFLSATRAGNPASGTGRRSFPPRVVAGDEPHYLLATSAILHGELTSVRPAYARVRAGGRDAGLRFAGVALDHHTLIVGDRHAAFVRDVTRRRRMPETLSLYLHAPSRTEPAMAI